MKGFKLSVIFHIFLLATVCFTGCRRSGGEVWEDTKSCSRHLGRGVKTLGGKHGDSRQIGSRDDFCVDDGDVVSFNENEFIPLQDEDGRDMVCMSDAQQPRETPGDPGSSIPGIEAFRDPSRDPNLAPIFQNISFDLNSNLVKGDRNLSILRNIADFMRRHPNVYVFVEGHCCERGPDAYNLALGARRANSIRNMLIQDGVSSDNVFTISYGRERPFVQGNDDAALAQNRRGQFKIYMR
jgi:peptidoglycan-associated lipoprotein